MRVFSRCGRTQAVGIGSESYVAGCNIMRKIRLTLVSGRFLELERDFSGRLALQEELKSFPLGAVWDYHCMRQGVPAGMDFMDSIRGYEETELSKRS